jgi:2-dehydropantoate 2-reductase
MVYATRELFSILKSNDIKITPKKLLFYYLPANIIGKIWQMVMKTKIAEYAMAKHTIVGKDEIETLEEQFMVLNIKKIELKYYNEL